MMDTFNILRELVDDVDCKPGWVFSLVDENGALRLRITDTKSIDAYNPGKPFPLSHFFPVPTATYNKESWTRWLFECCRGVENHELGEWFRFGKERPFAPMHGPGENPYVVNSRRALKDALTRQDGSVAESFENMR